MNKNLKLSVCVSLKEKMGTENVLTDEEFAHAYEVGWQNAVKSAGAQEPLTYDCIHSATLQVQQANEEKKSKMSEADFVRLLLNQAKNELEKEKKEEK